MALLKMIKRGAERAGSNLESYIGGLLGEDVKSLTEEERRALRRQGLASIFESMARGVPATGGLRQTAADLGARLEERRARQQQAAAEAELGQITPYLFGTAPPAPDMTPSAEGLQNVAVTARPTVSPQRALERFYSTPQGRAAAQLAPDLVRLAQEGVTGRTVGGAVYNPLTQQFSRPPEQPQPRTPVREVDLGNAVIVYYSDGTSERMSKGMAPGAGGAGGGRDPQDLRKEVNAQLKPYAEVGDMWAKVRQAGQNPTAANDLALIFGYMKILDPGSVVREGEFANAQNSAGVPDRLRATYNNILRGERLTEVQRQDFLRSAYGAVQSQVPRVQSVVDYYTDVANAIGVKPESVIRNPLRDAVVPKVRSDADYEKLAPGTLFEDPNGNLRTKPRSK